MGKMWVECNGASVICIGRYHMLLYRKYGFGHSWPVLAGQFLWGLAAIKKGAGTAWIQGKIEGCRLGVYTLDCERESLKQVLRWQEREIRSLLSESATRQLYWSAYFALAGA